MILREFADAVVAEAKLEFLNLNKRKLLTSFPTLLPQELVLLLIFVLRLQFFPLMLKLIAWDGEKQVLHVILIILFWHLARVDYGGGNVTEYYDLNQIGMLLALMDEVYTGSTIGDEGPDLESEDSNTMALADPLFLELLQDENDGLAERHLTSPAMAVALQVDVSTPPL
ncbi:hypothetical protein RHMOL_Rhmol04G0353900 [Rhododendron molle]|uniref:Uncharacterized protein n=1 Tax=Rhododendron molle TaxID=49168 RepID=A0ACC0PA60_RHOML|nr:hypothetical protein RHMOL_Rhmol04G0353900 [Rhododendron molle]